MRSLTVIQPGSGGVRSALIGGSCSLHGFHGASQLQLEFRDRVRLELGFELQITHRVP